VLVPVPGENPTVSPPAGRLLPAASLARNVTVTELPEATVLFDTVTDEVEVETEPGVTVMVGAVDVTAAALIVAPMVVAVPAVTPVKLAV
jgi:hypothetical protein